MTNVSSVEKMAELMQQMEESSPRVAALQYCLKQVAEKVEDAEKRNAELEARCAALAAEKEKFAVECAATKIAIAYLKSGRHDFTLNTPATDAFLAEVRASAIEHAAAERWGSGYIFNELNELAAQIRKGVQS
ncbi:TPA: hypothetical protein OTT96_002787 [Enterobacter hormaechei]|uniref:hypothetical protein n=1 Tax=Enterobacter cloacae complex sp. 357B1 TaxID=3395827 RepID=UPI003CF247DB|nr:hypothetical protein [Enterobacter hormaechei]